MKAHFIRRHASPIAVAALVLSACTSWRVQQVAPAVLLREMQPDMVRIDRADGARLVLTRPMLVGDSVQARQGTVAVADITSIAVRRLDPLKTGGLVGGILVGGAVLCLLSECYPDFGTFFPEPSSRRIR